jgi:hypothetical protein
MSNNKYGFKREDFTKPFKKERTDRIKTDPRLKQKQFRISLMIQGGL